MNKKISGIIIDVVLIGCTLIGPVWFGYNTWKKLGDKDDDKPKDVKNR